MVIIEEGYPYKKENDKIIVHVVRYGKETSPHRGGTWYDFEITKGWEPEEYRRLFGNVMSEFHHKEFELRNPYYFDVSDLKTEGWYPIALYEKIFGKRSKRWYKKFSGYKSEENFVKIEKKISDYLKKHGYDSVIFYYRIRDIAIPRQLFLLT